MARLRDAWWLVVASCVVAVAADAKKGEKTPTKPYCTLRLDPKKTTPPTPDKIAEDKPDDVMRFHFINSGAGLCVLVECPGPGVKEAVLADCGTGSGRFAMTPPEVFAYLDSYLAGEKAYSVVVSHGDVDHYSMLKPYADRAYGVPLPDGKTLRPTRVIYGGDFDDYKCRKDTPALAGWGGRTASEPDAVGSRSSGRKRPRNNNNSDDEDDDDSDMQTDDDPDTAPSPGKIPSDDGPPKPPPPPGPDDLDVRSRELTQGLIPAMQYFDDKGLVAATKKSPRFMPWFACGKAKFYVLTAPRMPVDTNPRSVVMGVKYGTFEALLPGDAEGNTEESAYANSDKLRELGDESVSGKIDLFAAAHHGASTHGSNGDNWVREAGARVAIFSSGMTRRSSAGKPFMKHGHPMTPITDRFATLGAAAPAVACQHAFVQCVKPPDDDPMGTGTGTAKKKKKKGNRKEKAWDCTLQPSRAEAVFSTAASGTIVVDAKADASMVMRFPRKTSPAWAEVPDPADASTDINLLDGQDKKCTFAAPPPPAPP